jgi:hypothetical protein
LGPITTPEITEPVDMPTPNTPPARNSRNVLLTPPPDLVDEMLDHYIDWRRDAAAVWRAYTAWVNAPASEEPFRFSAYNAALEQEQSAATTYAVVIDNLRRSAVP